MEIHELDGADGRLPLSIEEIENLKVPDAFAPVVGYRRFVIPWPYPDENHYLVQKGQYWVPQEPTVAHCRRPGSAGPCEHAVPAQSCGCGLHAWLDIEEALRYYMTTMAGWVLASVIGWGRVLFDEDFWRAEQAQVVAFADPKDTHYGKLQIVQRSTGAWLERTAAIYKVPILSLEELQEYTLMYGEEYIEHG
jgi:hypothetical protein